ELHLRLNPARRATLGGLARRHQRDLRLKSELGEQNTERDVVGGLHAQIVERHLDGDVRLQTGELARRARRVGLTLEQLANALGTAQTEVLHFTDAGEQLVDGAERSNQRLRRLVADPLHAGNVVDRVPGQRHHFDDLLRRHAEALPDVPTPDPTRLERASATTARHVQRYVRTDELHEILITGD